MTLAERLRPQGFFWRVAAILLCAVALSLAIGAVFVHADRAQLQVELVASHAANRIADAERMLAMAEVNSAPAIVKALVTAGVRSDTEAAVPVDANSYPALREHFTATLVQRLGAETVVATAVVGDGASRVRFVARLRNAQGGHRQWSALEQLDRPVPPPRFLLPSLIALLLAMSAAALLAVRWATQPLSALAAAARALGTPDEGGPLSEQGPVEVRQAAHAFNEMRQRITAMVDEKTRMLAAISHDLRAPITRMRLRLEMLADGEARDKLITDLDELRRLTDEALEFLRGTARGEVIAPCDLARLVGAIAQEASEAGHAVAVTGAERLVLQARSGALRRCIQNLVGNALKHAGHAEVEIAERQGSAWIWVRDRGLGMSPAELARAFEPFFRGDPARGHAAGFGLGLPIARAIAREHGGDVTLRSRSGGGVEVELRLPVAH
jgi:signal transduction histidine kinase